MPDARITDRLAQVVDLERPASVDVAVELQHAPTPSVHSKAERQVAIEGLKHAFEDVAKPVIEAITDLGGTVHASTWLNDTVYATIAPELVHTLKKIDAVEALDVAGTVTFD